MVLMLVIGIAIYNLIFVPKKKLSKRQIKLVPPKDFFKDLKTGLIYMSQKKEISKLILSKFI